MTSHNNPYPKKNTLHLTNKESEALICVFDNLLAGRGMTVPDADTLDGIARILIKHRGYAMIDRRETRNPAEIWGRS